MARDGKDSCNRNNMTNANKRGRKETWELLLIENGMEVKKGEEGKK